MHRPRRRLFDDGVLTVPVFRGREFKFAPTGIWIARGIRTSFQDALILVLLAFNCCIWDLKDARHRGTEDPSSTCHFRSSGFTLHSPGTRCMEDLCTEIQVCQLPYRGQEAAHSLSGGDPEAECGFRCSDEISPSPYVLLALGLSVLNV